MSKALRVRLLVVLARIFVNVVLSLFTDVHQIRAERLRQGEAVWSNRLIHSKLLDRNLQLIVIVRPADVDLPRIALGARGLPVCVNHVRSHLATRTKILSS